MQRWRDSVFGARWIDTRLGSSGAEQWCCSHLFLFFFSPPPFMLPFFVFCFVFWVFFFQDLQSLSGNRLWFVINEQISFLMLQLKYWWIWFNTTAQESRGNLAPLKGPVFRILVASNANNAADYVNVDIVLWCLTWFFCKSTKNMFVFSIPFAILHTRALYLLFLWGRTCRHNL